MRALTALVAGLACALLVVGVALIPLLHPTYTRLLVERYSRTAESGLSLAEMRRSGELVREFVAGETSDSLPARVAGRAAFDEAAISHLRDVRGVLTAARTFTGVLAVLLAVGLGVAIARREFELVSRSLLFGAGFCALFVVLGALAGAVSFDALFTWFHGLFFSAGTWQFASDSLLIQLFPEAFWATAGVTWAVMVALGGVLLGVTGWFLRGAETRPTVAGSTSQT